VGLPVFSFEQRWRFAPAPEEIWAILARTHEYQRWWGWLRSFDAPPLAVGSVAHCVIGPPLPYALRLTIEVVELDPGRRVCTRVGGDLEGTAQMSIAPDASAPTARPGSGVPGSAVSLSWEVALRRPLLVALARIARPVLEWGHDWVVATGARQFEARALRQSPGSPGSPLLG